jgi:hypothetical protein
MSDPEGPPLELQADEEEQNADAVLYHEPDDEGY